MTFIDELVVCCIRMKIHQQKAAYFYYYNFKIKNGKT